MRAPTTAPAPTGLVAFEIRCCAACGAAYGYVPRAGRVPTYCQVCRPAMRSLLHGRFAPALHVLAHVLRLTGRTAR